MAFVREALGRGQPRQAIREALGRAGWGAHDVGAALDAFADMDFPVPVPRPRPSLTARDAFLYLLLFTTLYLVSFNLGNLAFQFINHAFPDPVDPSGDAYFRDAVRWSVSTLVVAFPVFLLMTRTTERALQRDPVKRASPVRRWLTYLTLFIAACALIGDVVALVYRLLGGELTIRFTLKVLTVGVIAGTGFGYYLSGLREDEGVRS